MDILLTHGYFLYQDPHEMQIMKPYPPLGILYISSYLKSKDFDVGVFDTTFSTMEKFQNFVISQVWPACKSMCIVINRLEGLDGRRANLFRLLARSAGRQECGQ